MWVYTHDTTSVPRYKDLILERKKQCSILYIIQQVLCTQIITSQTSPDSSTRNYLWILHTHFGSDSKDTVMNMLFVLCCLGLHITTTAIGQISSSNRYHNKSTKNNTDQFQTQLVIILLTTSHILASWCFFIAFLIYLLITPTSFPQTTCWRFTLTPIPFEFNYII